MQPRSQGFSLEGGRGPYHLQGKSPGNEVAGKQNLEKVDASAIYKTIISLTLLLIFEIRPSDKRMNQSLL